LQHNEISAERSRLVQDEAGALNRRTEKQCENLIEYTATRQVARECFQILRCAIVEAGDCPAREEWLRIIDRYEASIPDEDILGICTKAAHPENQRR
jgi:hypothetical protein